MLHPFQNKYSWSSPKKIKAPNGAFTNY